MLNPHFCWLNHVKPSFLLVFQHHFFMVRIPLPFRPRSLAPRFLCAQRVPPHRARRSGAGLPGALHPGLHHGVGGEAMGGKRGKIMRILWILDGIYNLFFRIFHYHPIFLGGFDFFMGLVKNWGERWKIMRILWEYYETFYPDPWFLFFEGLLFHGYNRYPQRGLWFYWPHQLGYGAPIGPASNFCSNQRWGQQLRMETQSG